MGGEKRERKNPGDDLDNDAGERAGSRSSSPDLPRNVRHDLRSSIGQVIGYAELWLDDIEEEGRVADVEGLCRDLAKLKAAGRRILDVVNEYVDPVGEHARDLDSWSAEAAARKVAAGEDLTRHAGDSIEDE